MSILDQIIQHKKKEVAAAKKQTPLSELKKSVLGTPRRTRSLLKALKNKRPLAVIAEIKKKSPSRGILRRDFNALSIARAYEKGGASALSVLTDKNFFGGSAQILKKVRAVTKLPILRKEFIIDEYQIWEARALGADAILLIASILTTAELKRFYELAESLDLDVLFEAHSLPELKKVLPLKPKIVGVNNRDLRTFEVSLQTTVALAPFVRKKAVLVTESGIFSHQHLLKLRKSGVSAALVGEALMREADIPKALKKLIKG